MQKAGLLTLQSRPATELFPAVRPTQNGQPFASSGKWIRTLPLDVKYLLPQKPRSLTRHRADSVHKLSSG